MAGRQNGELAYDVIDYLSAIRGYCEMGEMARTKAEGGDALIGHLDAAIETADEATALLRKPRASE